MPNRESSTLTLAVLAGTALLVSCCLATLLVAAVTSSIAVGATLGMAVGVLTAGSVTVLAVDARGARASASPRRERRA